jgi:hypothetical protein
MAVMLMMIFDLTNMFGPEDSQMKPQPGAAYSRTQKTSMGFIVIF